MFQVKICIAFLCSGFCISLAAQNLVLNPSYEDYDSCVLNISSYGNPWVNNWINPTSANPDYFNACSINPDAQPYNVISTNRQYPRTGNGTSGIVPMQINQQGGHLAGEFVEGSLSIPLIRDSVYCVKFYLSLSEYLNLAIDQFGVYFSNTPVSVNSYFLNVTPQVQNPKGVFFTDTLGWMKWQGVYKANGGEQFFIIGNFNSFANTNYEFQQPAHGNFQDSISYYYIDDVSVEEVPSQYAVLDLGNDSIICSTASFSHPLSIPAIYDSVKWNTGSTANSIIITDTGRYSVIAYFGDCEARDTVVFSLHEPPPTFPIPDTTLCEAALPIVIASPSGFESYTWSNGGIDSVTSLQQGGTYTLAAWDGCNFYRDTFAVAATPAAQLPIVSDTAVCEQEGSMALQAAGNNLKWYTDSLTEAYSATAPLISLTNAGNTTYYVSQSIGGCESPKAAVSIFVKPLPRASLQSRYEPCRGEEFALYLPLQPSYTYLWNTGETAYSIAIDSSATYSYTITNDCGSTSGETEVQFINCNTCLYAPQAFTPNGDGNNDYYQTYTSCSLKYYQLRIFNRLGEKMFETNDQYGKWDGMYKDEPQPNNVYVYTVTIVDEDNETTAFKGSLMLIR